MNLNQITLPSLDLTISIPFYRKLGLNLIVEALPNHARFLCRAGNSRFSLHLKDSLPNGDDICVYFECEDFDQYVKSVKQKGIKFDTELKDEK